MLSRITSQREKRKFETYDMEWTPGRAKVGDSEPTKLKDNLRLVGSYDGKRYRAFYTVDDFLNARLTAENNEKWFYAHYGGMADSQFLLERLISRIPEFQVDASFSGSSAIIIHVRKGQHVWHFIDSFWLLRDKLANIGAVVGLDKLGEEYACSNFPHCGHVDELDNRYLDPGRDPSCSHPTDKRHDDFCTLCGKQFPHAMCVFWAKMPELKEYNERDCVILYRAIEQFEDVLFQLGGQLQMTIASCAMHLFRRVYLQDNIRTNAAVNGWARLAYTSSRVEVFQSRCEEAHYFDLNSSFPYSMTFDCPGNVKKGGLKDGKLPKNRLGSIFIADCEVEVPEMYLPPLPYRHDNRVFFPIGKWRSWFSGIDLELLERRGGRILKVYQSIEFEKQSYLRDYALDIYARRKASKTSFEKLVYKLLMNSLYGKFGERTEKTGLLVNPESPHCPHKVKHRCQSWPACEHALAGNECDLCMQHLFGSAWLVTDNVPLSHEWVPIAVEITSRSRMNLEGHLWNAQHDIYYCDTDSVITTANLPSDPTTLGALKLEDEIKNGEFVACKIYAVDVVTTEDHLKKNPHYGPTHWSTKAKGFSRMNYPKFCDVRLGEEIQIARMTRLRELYRKGATSPEEAIVSKSLVQKCMPKRCMFPSGQSRPWSVAEIENNYMDLSIHIEPPEPPATVADVS